jgi:cell shape-determining protein MreD
MPIMPSGSEEITPLLGVISLSFWIVHKPEFMGWIPVIIIGIFNDVLYGSSLGIACLSAILIRLVIVKLLIKIKYINIYHTVFCVGLSLFIWILVNSILNSMLYYDNYNYISLIFQFLVSLIISPIIVFIKIFLLKKMFI